MCDSKDSLVLFREICRKQGITNQKIKNDEKYENLTSKKKKNSMKKLLRMSWLTKCVVYLLIFPIKKWIQSCAYIGNYFGGGKSTQVNFPDEWIYCEVSGRQLANEITIWILNKLFGKGSHRSLSSFLFTVYGFSIQYEIVTAWIIQIWRKCPYVNPIDLHANGQKLFPLPIHGSILYLPIVCWVRMKNRTKILPIKIKSCN